MSKHVEVSTNKGFWATISSPEARKAQLAVVGVIISLATAGLIPPDIGIWVTTIVASLTAAGVYAVPNKTVEPTPIVVPATYSGEVRG